MTLNLWRRQSRPAAARTGRISCTFTLSREMLRAYLCCYWIRLCSDRVSKPGWDVRSPPSTCNGLAAIPAQQTVGKERLVDLHLQGKTALVTGGSRGIGRAIA